MDPSLVSHYYKRGFKDKFFRQGTDDYTNYLAGSYAVAEYYPSIGGMVRDKDINNCYSLFL